MFCGTAENADIGSMPIRPWEEAYVALRSRVGVRGVSRIRKADMAGASGTSFIYIGRKRYCRIGVGVQCFATSTPLPCKASKSSTLQVGNLAETREVARGAGQICSELPAVSWDRVERG